MHEAKTDSFYIRVEPSVKAAFFEASARLPGGPSAVLRWLAIAFTEGRVTVTDPTHKE